MNEVPHFASVVLLVWKKRFAPLSSLAACMNSGGAFNCYWKMPFRKKCRITMENINDAPMTLYYQVNYVLTDAVEDETYFHV
ncbi:hypothetical protein KGMB02408_41880 [Bacteroides faecalis]|uniref:Uncharacterized protein n=1 Tax=Bacteroides faecalis TaxID=2447885 RepID=A0A401M0H5_9BACE|nr:hypothetical protein KGMB02408_41880 [Bacteroides faecalis]